MGLATRITNDGNPIWPSRSGSQAYLEGGTALQRRSPGRL